MAKAGNQEKNLPDSFFPLSIFLKMKVPFLDLALQHQALRPEALAALTATYDATRFCLGKDVEDFEKNFAATLGYPRALGMNSGTAPLHVACLIAGFAPGDEIITAPFTFISSAWGINYVGAKPVFADIEGGTFNLDPAKVAAAITPRTQGHYRRASVWPAGADGRDPWRSRGSTVFS